MFTLVENSRVSEKCEARLNSRSWGNDVEIVQGDDYIVKVKEIGDYMGWCIATFRTVSKFKAWMKAMQIEINELKDYHNYNGQRYWRFSLKQRVVSSYFWHPHDLPFGCGDRYIWHQGKTRSDLETFFAPVINNGSIVNGFVQKRGDDRIVYRCNPNSSFYTLYGNMTFDEHLNTFYRGKEVFF